MEPIANRFQQPGSNLAKAASPCRSRNVVRRIGPVLFVPVSATPLFCFIPCVNVASLVLTDAWGLSRGLSNLLNIGRNFNPDHLVTVNAV